MALPNRSISDAELEVLKVLWQHGPGTVRQINTHLGRRKRQWAHNTVLTLLTRLREKGCVEADTSRVAHVFRPIVSRDKLLRQRLAELSERLCDGTTGPLVHALLQGRKLSDEELDELRRLLSELKRKRSRGE